MSVLLLMIVLAVGCSSSTGLQVGTALIECSSSASAWQMQQQLSGFSPFVMMVSSGSYDTEELGAYGWVLRLEFESLSAMDQCRPLPHHDPWDNPAVDMYTKRNRIVITIPSGTGVEKKEFRWRGGVIAEVVFLPVLERPALGVTEVNPDGSLTRRVVYLDGARPQFDFHVGPFSPTDERAQRINA